MSVKLLKFNKTSDKNEPDEEIIVEPPMIIGRGSFLKCGEKKLSRKHATLDWDENGIVISSTHSNPTFICVNKKESILYEGECATLFHGDSFGFFPTSFWYRVILPSHQHKKESPKENEAKEPNQDETHPTSAKNKFFLEPTIEEELSSTKESPKNVENTCPNDHDNSSIKSPEKEPLSKLESKDQPSQPNFNNIDTAKDIYDSVKEHILNRKREVPAWLNTQDLQSPKKQKNVVNSTNEKENKKDPATHSHGRKKQKKTNSSEMGVNDLSDEAASKNQIKKISRPVKKNSPKKANKTYHCMSLDMDESVTNVSNTATLHNMSDEDEEVPSKKISSPEKTGLPKDSKAASPTSKEAEPGTSIQKNTTVTTESTSKADATPAQKKQHVKRSSCPYGANCYRTNPQHKIDNAHPGDSDYASEDDETDPDDDRPECEFGVTCYRKNPQHKAAFRHTRKPQPRRKAKKRKANGEDDDDAENEYDYDDPFLNDSSDDYAPTDSGSDSPWSGVEEEDTKRMLKEAKRFVKKKP